MRLLERTRLLDRVPVSLHELDNGLRVVLAHIDHKPIIACQVWYGVGSADEVAGKTGLAHFLEHLMFKGTKRYPEGHLDRTMERLGGDTNAATWLDWTYYKVKVPSRHLEQVLDLEADRMANLEIGDAGFRSEKEVVKNERLLRVDDDPNGMAEERFFEAFFGEHPYAQPTIGHMADIEGLALGDVETFYRAYYNPANAVLSLAGAMDEAETLEVVRRTFGAVSTGTRRDRRRLLGKVARRTTDQMTIEAPVAQARLLIGYSSPAKYTRDSILCAMVNELLLGARSAAVYRRTVTEEELAVYANGWPGALHLPSLFQVEWVLSEPRFEGRVLEILDEEIERIAQGSIDPDELAGALNRVRMGYLGLLQSVEGVTGALGEMALLSDGLGWYNRSAALMEGITPRDLAGYARKHLGRGERLALLVKPREGDAP